MLGLKSDKDVLVQMALQGMLPLVAEMLRESPAIKELVSKIALAEAEAKAAHEKAIEHYAKLREDVANLLSENGLQFVIDNYAKAQAEANPVPQEVTSGADGQAV